MFLLPDISTPWSRQLVDAVITESCCIPINIRLCANEAQPSHGGRHPSVHCEQRYPGVVAAPGVQEERGKHQLFEDFASSLVSLLYSWEGMRTRYSPPSSDVACDPTNAAGAA